MADRILQNQAFMDGTYAGAAFQNAESTILEVTLTGVDFRKTANKSKWFNGQLAVTFTVDNTEGQGPLDLIIVKDELDNTKFSYIDDSMVVQLIDTTQDPQVVTTLTLGTDYTVAFTEDTPTADKDYLVVTFSGAPGRAASIPVGSIVTISFRGNKVSA